MMGKQQVAEVIEEMVDAVLDGDQPGLLARVDTILRGPKWDAYAVTATLAAAVGQSVVLAPGETFHRVKVKRVNLDGTVTEASADDLPPHMRLFARMVAAMNNGDPDLARDLFIGTVGEHSARAHDVILWGVCQLVRWGLGRVARAS